jgi:hypothetical protein
MGFTDKACKLTVNPKTGETRVYDKKIELLNVKNKLRMIVVDGYLAGRTSATPEDVMERDRLLDIEKRIQNGEEIAVWEQQATI